jgi:NAD-dependent dihydropyrimidine dehydrogenase PreA subunit
MKYLLNVVSLEFDEKMCTGCGKCTEVCPHGVFASNGSKVRISDRDKCMECGACMMNCAFDAIHVRAGVGCAYAILWSKLKKRKPACSCGGEDNPGCCI